MAWNNDIGKVGEQLAQKHLRDNGYAILETNWRLGKMEADIIAYREGLVVFVEVKTRSSSCFGEPQEFVDNKKQRAYLKMANAYLLQRGYSEEVRFDIIAIEVGATGFSLNHIENTFNAIDLWKRPARRCSGLRSLK